MTNHHNADQRPELDTHIQAHDGAFFIEEEPNNEALIERIAEYQIRAAEWSKDPYTPAAERLGALEVGEAVAQLPRKQFLTAYDKNVAFMDARQLATKQSASADREVYEHHLLEGAISYAIGFSREYAKERNLPLHEAFFAARDEAVRHPLVDLAVDVVEEAHRLGVSSPYGIIENDGVKRVVVWEDFGNKPASVYVFDEVSAAATHNADRSNASAHWMGLKSFVENIFAEEVGEILGPKEYKYLARVKKLSNMMVKKAKPQETNIIETTRLALQHFDFDPEDYDAIKDFVCDHPEFVPEKGLFGLGSFVFSWGGEKLDAKDPKETPKKRASVAIQASGGGNGIVWIINVNDLDLPKDEPTYDVRRQWQVAVSTDGAVTLAVERYRQSGKPFEEYSMDAALQRLDDDAPVLSQLLAGSESLNLLSAAVIDKKKKFKEDMAAITDFEKNPVIKTSKNQYDASGSKLLRDKKGEVIKKEGTRTLHGDSLDRELDKRREAARKGRILPTSGVTPFDIY